MRRGVELPGVFPPELRAQVTALACSVPQTQQVPLARWSRSELARQIATLLPACSVSASSIGRWLTAERIRPWRYRFWQHIHDPAAFLARARPVLRYYAGAASLLAQGTWVVCLDEKTSIQARQAEQAPQAAMAHHPLRLSPRYQRHGALQLMAGLSVADGQVFGQCFARKRFEDFQNFITNVVVPQAQQRKVHTAVLILDNGPTHAPARLERWLYEQSHKQAWRVCFIVCWLPVNASWLDQIEIWFSILQRKLLQPSHFTSTAALQQAISAFIAHYNQTAKSICWSYTVEKLELKLGTNL
jgi:hypothetical protein